VLLVALIASFKFLAGGLHCSPFKSKDRGLMAGFTILVVIGIAVLPGGLSR
jgi:hypothetical protein